MVILDRRPHFISFWREEAPFYWLLERGGTVLLSKSIWEEVGGFFLFMSKTMPEVGWSFILCPKLDLEGWSSRSSYVIGVALWERSI